MKRNLDLLFPLKKRKFIKKIPKVRALLGDLCLGPIKRNSISLLREKEIHKHREWVLKLRFRNKNNNNNNNNNNNRIRDKRNKFRDNHKKKNNNKNNNLLRMLIIKSD